MTSQQQSPNNNNNNSNHSLGIELASDSHQFPPSVEANAVQNGEDDGDGLVRTPIQHSPQHHHQVARTPTTSAWDAWMQLTKAYIGPGCLSLPWAISQLGLPFGTLTIIIVAFWTSYNAWNIVALKRIIVKERLAQQQQQQPSSSSPQPRLQVTYADVGEWAYNKKFKDVLLISICVQQLAVCTVFLSFIGENIAAVLERTLVEEGERAPSHAFVITLALPFALGLSCLPNLKVLSPVVVVATVALFVGFSLLGVVIAAEWKHRPTPDEVNLYDVVWSQVPMAVCAILYSYEGICVCLPIESAMAEPKHFKTVFVTSMSFTAVVFAAVASLCVIAFGDVTNGSVTAFLVENLEDENVKWWLYLANTFCSIAVLLTYPLQLFPSFELIGPWLTRILRLDLGTHALVRQRQHPLVPVPDTSHFSPVPSSDVLNPDDRVIGNHDYHDAERISTDDNNNLSGVAVAKGTARATNDGTANGEDENYSVERETSLGAAATTAELEETVELGDTIPFFAAFPTPGDSPQLRAILVCFTYIMAIAIPNVQLLVSLAGALSGSATGLIIPPLLELAHVKRQEDELYRSITDPDYEDDADDEYNDEDDDNTGGDDSGLTRRAGVSPPPSRGDMQWKKRECYVLFGLGVVVCVFGTGAALLDIVKVYLG